MKIQAIVKKEMYMAKVLLVGFLFIYVAVLGLQILVPYIGGCYIDSLLEEHPAIILFVVGIGILNFSSMLLDRCNSRKSTWVPRHRKMKPFPATVSQEKSHVRYWRSKRYLAPLMRPHKVPRHPGLPGEEHRGFPAPLPLSPFYPPDLDRRVDSPALSGRGSRPSGRTSG